jgi:hypothetical protein
MVGGKLRKLKTVKRGLIALFIAITTLVISSCGFGNRASPSIALESCNIDGLVGVERDSLDRFVVPSSMPELNLLGWVANFPGGASPDEITASIFDNFGEVFSSASVKPSNRSDVANYYKKPGMENSGFDLKLQNPNNAGEYTITIQGRYDTRTILCIRTFSLIVQE